MKNLKRLKPILKGEINMNPKYTKDRKGKNIATRCRICGGQLTHPDDIKEEVHPKCVQNYKSKLR